MLSFKRPALLLMTAAGMALGQPALTLIQDTLYRADGTRFNGTMFITWNSFQTGDTSNIATADLTVPIVNGVLKTALAPTTTASAGAQYNITYNTQGRDQFTEVWAVPPSDVSLRVRDVRLSQGTVVGPAPVTTPIDISDVTGLSSQLDIRPQEGAGFAIARAAVINSSGQIDGASGNSSDCVRVDGSSGPCGGGVGSATLTSLFADGEIPAGVVNGANTVFGLNFTPSPAASLDLYRNGLMMKQGTDYAIAASTITFLGPLTPQSGDILVTNYRYAAPNNPLTNLALSQVICSGTGGGTTATVLTQLGSCTAPAGLLGVGDRIEVQFQYGHTGATTGFTGEIHFGGTTAISRTTTSAETALTGRITFGLSLNAQFTDVESWGNSLAFASAVGSATENTSASLTISFWGGMAGATTDSVILSNFTVIRYPAQSNP